MNATHAYAIKLHINPNVSPSPQAINAERGLLDLAQRGRLLPRCSDTANDRFRHERTFKRLLQIGVIWSTVVSVMAGRRMTAFPSSLPGILWYSYDQSEPFAGVCCEERELLSTWDYPARKPLRTMLSKDKPIQIFGSLHRAMLASKERDHNPTNGSVIAPHFDRRRTAKRPMSNQMKKSAGPRVTYTVTYGRPGRRTSPFLAKQDSDF